MQFAGIFASLMSVAKTSCEWHLRAMDDDKKEDPNLATTMKALLFFAPHVWWRTTATAFVIAFLKFYSLIPLAIYAIVCIGITSFLRWIHGEDLETGYYSFSSLSSPPLLKLLHMISISHC